MNHILTVSTEDISNISHREKRKQVGPPGRKVACLRAYEGRGRKEDVWSHKLQNVLFEEYQRFSKDGLKFNGEIIAALGKRIIPNSKGFQNVHSDSRKKSKLMTKIIKHWAQSVMDRLGIVS